jgi:hypothetical protein
MPPNSAFVLEKEPNSHDFLSIRMLTFTSFLSLVLRISQPSICFKMIVFGTYLGDQAIFYQIYDKIECKNIKFLNFTEVGGTCRKQCCLFWLPRAVDVKVSCSQIPRHAFAGIRTHDPLVESPTS